MVDCSHKGPTSERVGPRAQNFKIDLEGTTNAHDQQSEEFSSGSDEVECPICNGLISKKLVSDIAEAIPVGAPMTPEQFATWLRQFP